MAKLSRVMIAMFKEIKYIFSKRKEEKIVQRTCFRREFGEEAPRDSIRRAHPKLPLMIFVFECHFT